MITLTEFMIFLLWAIPVVFIHEFGHYIGWRMVGVKKPKIKLSFWIISVGEEKDLFKTTPSGFGFVLWLGVLTGYLYTLLFTNQVFIFIYILFSVMDIINMYHVLTAIKMKWNKTMGEYAIYLQENQLKKTKSARWQE